MPKEKAMVTLVIGDRYSRNFKRFCYDNWQEYAQKHGYDLVVFDKPLDMSARAKKRSPSWQKCLILSQPSVRKYRQIAWIDSDILINSASAPCICEQVSTDKVGAVDAYATPSTELHHVSLKRLYEYWECNRVTYVDNLLPEQFYTNYGLDPTFNRVVQAGVLVASPSCHRDVFQRAYDGYENRRGAEWNYEMRPLSYELLKEDVVQWIDYRFNVGWALEMSLHYPYLLGRRGLPERILKRLNLASWHPKHKLRAKCATIAYLNCYFLHFAGCASEMGLVDTSAKSVFAI